MDNPSERVSIVYNARSGKEDQAEELRACDCLKLLWDLLVRPGRPAARLSHGAVTRSARIEAIRRSGLVQADGEMIGHTPVAIQLVPKAVHVIMPKPVSASAAS